MSEPVCCNHNCQQGRNCPRRDRRQHDSLWRRLFGWLMTKRRSGFDRRQRVDYGDTGKTLYGLPIVIDDSVASGHAEFRSGRRRVDTAINVKEEK